MFPHVSVGVGRDVAGGWNAGVYLALGGLGLVVQKRSHSLDADEGVIVRLQQILERDVPYLINSTTSNNSNNNNTHTHTHTTTTTTNNNNNNNNNNNRRHSASRVTKRTARTKPRQGYTLARFPPNVLLLGNSVGWRSHQKGGKLY